MAAPSDSELLQQMQTRLESVVKAKEANATIGKGLDEKLRVAFKNPPKRPNLSAEKLQEEIRDRERRQNTTSMSLNEENRILREVQQLKEKLVQLQEVETFQEWVEATRKERNERFQQNKDYDLQVQQLNAGIKKLKLAIKLGVAATDFVTLDVNVPKDKMGSVIGKQFANIRQLEEECDVLVDIDNKQNIVRVISAPTNARKAKESIENITLATNHSIGLHPDTVKVLMFQKSKKLQELEQKLQLKIDINKVEGILTVMASPAKAKLLDKAIKELSESKVDISLSSEIVPKLIGKKGETINQLMEDTGALVDIDRVSNSVRLCGTRESVAMAKKFIVELIDTQSQREKEFTVNDTHIFDSPDYAAYKFEFFAEFLMANKASQLKILRTDAADARIKVFKKEKKIHVIGNKAQLKAMEDALRERLREFESRHWVYEVPDSHLLSLIIGKKGSKIKQLEEEGGDGNVRIDIQGNYVCVFGDNEGAIEAAKTTILELVDQNQRSVFLTSQHLVTILLNNKRAKLTEIESTSGCKVNLPPPPATGTSARINEGDQVKITLTGTLEAISEAKRQLEELDECHHVRYLPLDDDEIPTIIGKKGETILELESKSGAKLKVLKEENLPSELEMIGTEEQLTNVQKAIDELLQTKNRQILQLDAFATGCLIGKKGDRIKALRLEHPDANLDAFPTRGQVRIKANSQEALKKCVDHVLHTLRETVVLESVKINQGAAPSVNFHTILQKNEAIATRLQELEAEGGENMKVTIQEDGKAAKIRGPAMGIGTLKKFLEMLVASDSHFVETIPLPTFAFTNVLLVKGGESEGKLNENALRICKQTGCEIRIKRNSSATGYNAHEKEDGVIRIEGTNAAKVYEAKASVEKVLQFYFGDCFCVLENLPRSAISRLYELLPSLSAEFPVFFSLPSPTSLKVFTDSKATTKEIAQTLEKELKVWKKQHVELPIPSWLVPILVGKNGETIKKLSADCNNAKLTLDLPTAADQKTENNRTLTISARDDATVQLAVKSVKELLNHHQNLTSTIDVSKEKLDLVLSIRKEASGLQFHVLDDQDKQGSGALQVMIYGSDHDERERIVEKIEHTLETCVIEKIVLPSTLSANATGAVIGALIGKSGANIKALQKEFPTVKIDIRRGENVITLKGPKEEAAQVKSVMEDKVQELVEQEEQHQQRRGGGRQNYEADELEEKKSKSSDVNDNDNTLSDENIQPNGNNSSSTPAAQQNHPPKSVAVPGGSASMSTLKLTKNQRRRMRKRAENEKESEGVLSMIMGSSSSDSRITTTTTVNSTTTTATEDGGYYHSSSGYSLRL